MKYLVTYGPNPLCIQMPHTVANIFKSEAFLWKVHDNFESAYLDVLERLIETVEKCMCFTVQKNMTRGQIEQLVLHIAILERALENLDQWLEMKPCANFLKKALNTSKQPYAIRR